VFTYVNIGHLKVKNGLGFNTICISVYLCDITVQDIPMVKTASSLFNSSILCTYTTSTLCLSWNYQETNFQFSQKSISMCD